MLTRAEQAYLAVAAQALTDAADGLREDMDRYDYQQQEEERERWQHDSVAQKDYQDWIDSLKGER